MAFQTSDRMLWNHTLLSITPEHERKLLKQGKFLLKPMISSIFDFLYLSSSMSNCGPDHIIAFGCSTIMASHSAFVVSSAAFSSCITLQYRQMQTRSSSFFHFLKMMEPIFWSGARLLQFHP